MEYGQTRAQLLASLDVSMGGRVAEEIKFGKTKVRSQPDSGLVCVIVSLLVPNH